MNRGVRIREIKNPAIDFLINIDWLFSAAKKWPYIEETAIARTPGAKIPNINLDDENSWENNFTIIVSGMSRMNKIPTKLNQKLYFANFWARINPTISPLSSICFANKTVDILLLATQIDSAKITITPKTPNSETFNDW